MGPVPVMHSISDVQAYLKKLAAQTQRGSVLFVPKVYSTRLVDRRYPTRYELDEAVGDREAMTDNGYASVLNSALLKRLNITRNTPQPTNGKIIKDDKGEPTGLILGAGQLLGPLRSLADFFRCRAAQSFEDDAGHLQSCGNHQHHRPWAAGRRLSHLSGAEAARRDDGAHCRHLFDQRRGQAWRGKARRLRAFPSSRVGAMSGCAWVRSRRLSMAAFSSARLICANPTANNTEVYGYHDPAYRGVLNVPPDNLTEMAKTANRLGWQMTAHTTGGGAIDALLNAYESANQESPIRDRRFTVTHGNFPNAEAIAKAKRLGVAFDCQPQWHHFDGPVLGGVFGPERTKWFLPLRSMLDAGLVVAGGSDHMIRYDPRQAINAYHPFFAMWMTITRKMADGRVLGPEQRITREEALRMWTLAGAWLTFEENIKGSIEPGKLADFVVITKDYLTVPEDEIKDIEALLTVVDGRVVHGNEAALK